MPAIARSLLVTAWCSLLLSQTCLAQPIATAPYPSATVLETSALTVQGYASNEPLPPQVWYRRKPVDFIGVEIGVIGLVRQKPTGQVIAVDDSGNVLLDADELQGDMQFGLNTKIDVYQISNGLGGTDLQFGYWGINSMDATRSVAANEVHTSFFGGTTADQISAFNYNYSTNLYSAEVNLRCCNAARVRPLVGIRYLKMEDTFNQFEFISGGTSAFSSLTNNSLFGAQAGFEATLLRYRSWDWFVSGKYGAMQNRVEGAAQVALGTTTAIKDYRGDEFCSLVDGEAGFVYQFVDSLRFKVAYQGLYADKIASGVDQSGNIDFFGTSAQAFFDSRYWQGVNLTAMFSF